MAAARPDDIATLVYTSGTTGPPKGAMLTVANVEFAIRTLVDGGGFTSPPPSHDDLLLSYLPLCHVAERIFTTWFNAGAGVQVNFAESIATVQANLREIQPTILFGVPRIWEKILAGGADQAGLRVAGQAAQLQALAAVADRIGAHSRAYRRPAHPGDADLAYAVGWVFFYRALRERIGMRKVPIRRLGCRADRAGGAASSSWASACRCTRSTA